MVTSGSREVELDAAAVTRYFAEHHLRVDKGAAGAEVIGLACGGVGIFSPLLFKEGWHRR